MKMSSKLGRKGDPRMHKAVSARLQNPKLSLYEALRIGGFEYSENDDKSVLDSKQITLGQRKNQLSRRLRLARKNAAMKASLDSSAEAKMASPSSNTAVTDTVSPEMRQISGTDVSDNGTKNALSIPETNRRRADMINELAIGKTQSATNRGYIVRPDDATDEQSKRQRISCSEVQAANQKLIFNHSLHQGWLVQNMSTFRASETMMGGGALVGSNTGFNYPPTTLYNSQIQNQIPNPSLARFQPGPSAVAVSSLAATAQAVGLSLDQLALTLSSNPASLSKLVSESRNGESERSQEQMALDLFQVEIKGLYTKCMLAAGVDSSLTDQNTPKYINFATKAWEIERKRLQRMRRAANAERNETRLAVAFADTPSRNEVRALDEMDSQVRDNTKNQQDQSLPHWERNDHDDNDLNHGNDNENDHNHDHGHLKDHNGNTPEVHDSSNCDARHQHRVGECGHRAVLHKPKDGAAHIDFIVNDQIECYQGQDSVSLAGMSLKSFDSVWPSKYKCREADGPGAKTSAKNSGIPMDNNWGHLEPLAEPKTFKLSEIDSSDPEWTFDTSEEVDGGVMGLFELSKDTSGSTPT